MVDGITPCYYYSQASCSPIHEPAGTERDRGVNGAGGLWVTTRSPPSRAVAIRRKAHGGRQLSEATAQLSSYVPLLQKPSPTRRGCPRQLPTTTAGWSGHTHRGPCRESPASSSRRHAHPSRANVVIVLTLGGSCFLAYKHGRLDPSCTPYVVVSGQVS